MPRISKKKIAPGSSTIMLVDDTPDNLRLLEDMLRVRGDRVRSFLSGSLALAAAAKEVPDLVLLDIHMPEMDGYETCRRFKANPCLAAIPILFLSALSKPFDKVKAFRCGGVDYVTKPFQIPEVLARIETHLRLGRLEGKLRRQKARLDREVRSKTKRILGPRTGRKDCARFANLLAQQDSK